MQRVGRFEKVSFEQFASAMKEEFGFNEAEAKTMYDRIDLPVRATAGSAGYDFKSPVSFTLAPGASVKIPTGVRVQINDGWWLCCAPRSGLRTLELHKQTKKDHQRGCERRLHPMEWEQGTDQTPEI